MRIRLGNVLEFYCFVGKANEEKITEGVRTHKVETICLKCFKRLHDTILIPCKHAVYCYRCISTYSEETEKVCPSCMQ